MLVTEAVAAERSSDGEIVTIVAPRSDAYHDVGLHYAVLAMLLVPTLGALLPQDWIDRALGLVFGWNATLSFRLLMSSCSSMDRFPVVRLPGLSRCGWR